MLENSTLNVKVHGKRIYIVCTNLYRQDKLSALHLLNIFVLDTIRMLKRCREKQKIYFFPSDISSKHKVVNGEHELIRKLFIFDTPGAP